MSIFTAGVDEAGRGPLAGPVIAAAVILDPNNPIEGLTDSKKLSEAKREKLFAEINLKALAVGVGRAEPKEIDEINILQATMKAMQRAVANLKIMPDNVLVDGNRAPTFSCRAQAIIKGDLTEEAISAASIIAKVTRDREMIVLDAKYPGYGLAGHKGYPTQNHIRAIEKLGVTDIHRLTFTPVKHFIQSNVSNDCD